MQSETDWINQIDMDQENIAKETYKWFMRPEPREGLGEIYYIDDPILGKDTPVREMDVGMTRNAKSEDKKRMLIYLKPFQHVRIDKAKQLMGWYKSLHEPKGVRPRPCLLEGSIVNTPKGEVKIEDVKVGDAVYGYDFITGQTKLATVEAVSNQTKDEIVEIELENGETLKLTPEHLVFTENRGWVEAGQLSVEDSILELK